MSFIDIIKNAGTVAVEVVKANPVVAGGCVVGAAVIGYGGHRYLKHRKAKKAEAAPAVAAPAAAAAPQVLTDHNLSQMTFGQANAAGVLTQWKLVMDREVASELAKTA